MDWLEERVSQTLSEEKLALTGKRVLLFVSGGRDSVAMLEALAALYANTNELTVVSINYGLRGKDSEDDLALVKKHSERLKIPFIEKRPIYHAGNVQAWAREERLKIMRDAISDKTHDFFFLAHQLDDLVETLLFKIFRNQSPLRWVLPVKRGRILRPMLNLTRQEITTWLKEKGIDYRDDKSNFEKIYQRNFIRNVLLPNIEQVFGSQWKSKTASQLKQWMTLTKENLRVAHYIKTKGPTLGLLKEFYKLTPQWKKFYLHQELSKWSPRFRWTQNHLELILQKLSSKRNGLFYKSAQLTLGLDGQLLFKVKKDLPKIKELSYESIEPTPTFVYDPRKFCFYAEKSNFTLQLRLSVPGEKLTLAPSGETVSLKKWLQSHYIPMHLRRQAIVLELIEKTGEVRTLGIWIQNYQELKYFQRFNHKKESVNQWHTSQALLPQKNYYQVSLRK